MWVSGSCTHLSPQHQDFSVGFGIKNTLDWLLLKKAPNDSFNVRFCTRILCLRSGTRLVSDFLPANIKICAWNCLKFETCIHWFTLNLLCAGKHEEQTCCAKWQHECNVITWRQLGSRETDSCRMNHNPPTKQSTLTKAWKMAIVEWQCGQLLPYAERMSNQ